MSPQKYLTKLILVTLVDLHDLKCSIFETYSYNSTIISQHLFTMYNNGKFLKRMESSIFP